MPLVGMLLLSTCIYFCILHSSWYLFSGDCMQIGELVNSAVLDVLKIGRFHCFPV